MIVERIHFPPPTPCIQYVTSHVELYIAIKNERGRNSDDVISRHNTCLANAVVQSLLHSPQVRHCLSLYQAMVTIKNTLKYNF